MKKILFVIDTLKGAGAEKVLVTILNNLDYSKYKVDLFLIFKYGVLLKYVPKEVNIISLFKSFDYKAVKKIYSIMNHKMLYKKCVKDKYDIEIAFLDASPVFFVADSWNKKSKKIVWIHTDRLMSNAIVHKIQPENLYSKFNKIVCVSNQAKKAFISLYKNLSQSKLSMIHNPIESKYINQNISMEKFKFDKITLVSIGRLSYAKGYDRLIYVHKRLIDKGFKHQILIIGEGEQKNKLIELIKKLRVEKTFKLLGYIENPYSIVSKTDGFICSSRYEGYSLALAEAMILGKPVITTKVSGPMELIDNGKFGLAVENSKAGLYKGIKKFILNENLRNYYSQKSIERKGFFDLEKSMKQIENLLDNI